MIRYALNCDQGHEFEGWFRDSAAFDAQAAGGLVTCPSCQSPQVEKRIMAPGLARAGRQDGPAQVSTETPVALLDDQAREARALVASLREHIQRVAEDVGPRFAQEARRMHDGEIERRSIYGRATLDDVKALAADGIPALPLPVMPEERN